MYEMPYDTFVSFMKVVAAIAIIAMVISVWPGEDD
jgi:hypothetical protein